MIAPIPVALAVVGLIVSAYVRVKAVLLGMPVNVSLLGLIWVVLILALAAVVLLLARSILRDGGLRLRPVRAIASPGGTR